MQDSDYRNREQHSAATLGYYFNTQLSGRHDLTLGFYNRNDPDPRSMSFEEAVIYMAHELGQLTKPYVGHYAM